jgi:hypothetical protein
MYTRRGFIGAAAAGACLIFLNPFSMPAGSRPMRVYAAGNRNKRYLVGDPRNGCSTPIAAIDSIQNSHYREPERHLFNTA